MDFNLTKPQEFLKRSTRQFAQREIAPIAEQIEREDEIPHDLIQKMGKQGMFGIYLDRKYGGGGGTYFDLVLVLEELAQVSAAVALTSVVHALVAGLLHREANESQKDEFLPSLAQGTKIGSYVFTEPGTGSDPKLITSTAREEGDHFVLNGTKRFCSNATFDGTIGIAVRDGDGISTFVMDKKTPGLSVPVVWSLMGLRGGRLADVEMKDVRVPAANLLGKRGDGYTSLLNVVGYGKLNICAMILGISQSAVNEATKYAKERTARGGKPIAGFQMIQHLIADIASELEAMRWITYRLAFQADQGENILHSSALTKLFVGETADRVVRNALQVHGVYGLTKEFKIERFYRDVKMGSLVEGSNEIQRVIVARDLLR